MKKRRGILKKTVLILSGVLLVGVVFTAALLEPRIRISGWEELDETRLVKAQKTVEFLDENDRNIDNIIYDANRTYVSVNQVPAHTINAFVSVEDKRFYKHRGVDYKRIIGAAFNNIKTFSFKEGASTISQQLIKNTHLSLDKTIARKIKEIRIAKELERRYTKDEIMEMYLNILYFGDNMYGINTASKVFFNVKPENLSVAQSALLAGIINNPSKYNPYRNLDNAKKRRDLVLKTMMDNGKISEAQYCNALNEKLEVCRGNNYVNQYLNSVIKDATEILNCSKKELLSRKLTIGTFFDSGLEKSLRQVLFNSQIPNGADSHIMVFKNDDGSIAADVSLRNLNLANLKRQPGSTLKPLLCYAPALEKGDIYTCSPIQDAPASFGDYKPQNYNGKYYGYVTAEEALCKSLNIPAVKLLQSNGIEYSKSMANLAGIEFDVKDNNLALALGGMTKGVTLRQLADSFRVFPNAGRYSKSAAVRYIKDEKGRLIYKGEAKETEVFSQDTAFLINTMLEKCAKEGTAKKLAHFNNVCAKTGTVGDKNGNTDVYCMAYSPRYTVAVWIGGTDGKMPNTVTSSGIACQLAKQTFDILNDATFFAKPDSVRCRYIDMRELKEHHKVLLAGDDVSIKDKAPKWFSERFMPNEYSTVQQDDYFYYDDFLNLDFDNFKIIERFLD